MGLYPIGGPLINTKIYSLFSLSRAASLPRELRRGPWELLLEGNCPRAVVPSLWKVVFALMVLVDI